MSNIKNKKGFTLVEIVIVLAIAALILAAILIAVAGAQQSRRDSARRDAAGAIGALLEESAGNNNGNYPDNGGIAAADFVTIAQDRTQDPGAPDADEEYNITFDACPGGADATADDVHIEFTGTRQWTVCMGLESGDWFTATNE